MSAIDQFLDSITIGQLEADPYPIWERLRREAPVAWIPAADSWFITRYDDVAAVLRGEHGFGGATNHQTMNRVFGQPNILNTTGEEHDEIRQGVDCKLQPDPVLAMVNEYVRPVARHYLDLIADKGRADLVTEFFEPVSVEALRRVMGLDAVADTATIRRWFTELNGGVANFGQDPDIYAVSDRASREFEEAVAPLLEQLARHPDDSMTSHMMWAGREGTTPRPVSQIMPSLKVILLGGMQEPGHAAASSLHGLFTRPDQWKLLVEDPEEWIPLAIQEGLRWIAPIGCTDRQTTRETTLRGTALPAGTPVNVVLASANRDEDKFDSPELFDIDRASRAHQAFGGGEHFCAGHFFGRQVERIMFEELVKSMPDVAAAPDEDPVVTGWVFRAPKKLPVVFTPVRQQERIAVSGAATAPRNERESELLVSAMRLEAENVMSVELQAPDGTALPEWAPGAHIDLWSSETHFSKYSLCPAPGRGSSWRIAVAREEVSKGTSKFVHGELRPGMRVRVGHPANNFELVPAKSYLFIAGGIGITPLMPMMAQAARDNVDFTLLYCGRSRSRLPFLEELSAYGDKVRLFISSEGTRLDLAGAVEQALRAESTIYCCGPTRLMDQAQQVAEQHGGEVLCEHFTGVDALRDGDRPFEIRLARSGKALTVPADKTTLDVLREEGLDVLTSCQAGNCGSCETRVLQGIPEHRDVYLTKGQKARNDRMMVCVSRGGPGPIVLDL
ncbi:cytochrome P450 [Arthrobacter sp. GCM10027362]|uniref:cytochrome P450/oxidoreductase n=1 Tax=Arthrobacter sp. GCM10027362 TaxID=3273379 RepID=UPI00362C0D5D